MSGNLGFTPTDNRLLVRIGFEDEYGNIDGIVEAIGPDATIEIDDDIHILEGKYQRMTISGVECVLLRESDLRE